jgi:methylthioribose-1-phosphate isomerase
MLSEVKTHKQSIWWDTEKNCVTVIDQRLLPHKFKTLDLNNSWETAAAIKNMTVRGAPLIGVTAAFGFYLATLEAETENFHEFLKVKYNELLSTRPTAVNLKWALDEMMTTISGEKEIESIRKKSFSKAEEIKNDDIERCRMIGVHGLALLEKISSEKRGEPVNILTHCNAGRLACVEWGTATSAIYQAHNKGMNIHVWVDETRPRNQGAALTTYELAEEKIAHTLIPDNTGGLLMQSGKVDIVIVGADRIAKNGDVANKIGTYLKALACKHNSIPFFVAAPLSTFDFSIADGKAIDIEERDEHEVKHISGLYKNEIVEVLICPENSPALNYGFDITPHELVSGYITEKGIFSAENISTLH